jgi:hypothetical protein
METVKPSQIARREWENIRASLEMCGDIGEFDSKNHTNEKSISDLSLLVRNLMKMENKLSTHHYFTKEAAYVFSTFATIAGESLGLKRRLARAFGSGYSLVRTGDPCLSAMEKRLLKQIIFLKLFFPVEGYFNWDFNSPLVKAKMKVVFDKFVKWQNDPRSYFRDIEYHVSELKPIWRVLSLDSCSLTVDESIKTPEESFPNKPLLARKTPRDFKNLIFPK